MTGYRAWVQISKEKRVNLDICFSQGIFVWYKGTNQYQVYNLRIAKIYIIQDLFVDEHYQYHRETSNRWDYLETDQAKTEDVQFGDITDSEDPKRIYTLVLDHFFYSVGDNISEKPGKKDNDSQNSKQDITHFNDLENEPSGALDEGEEISSSINENLRQSSRAEVPWVLYPGQVTYSSNLISIWILSSQIQPDWNLKNTGTPSSLAWSTNTCVSQSNIHMIQTLRMLETNIDNKSDHKTNILQQAICRLDFLKWKETIQAEYDSLTKNET